MVLWVSFGLVKQIYLEPHGIGGIAQEVEPWLPHLGDFGHTI